MRTAAEFDAFYARTDPWGLAKYGRRDRAIKAIVAPFVRGKRVLELGCGEGHLTRTAFSDAQWVHGVDISPRAIERAPRLANADFAVGDLADLPLDGYDVIAAIECIYYLSAEERERFFARLSTHHRGPFILMSPTLGGQYFTHADLLGIFARHGMRLVLWKNAYVTRQPGAGFAAGIVTRLPYLRDAAAEAMPGRFRCHRCYVVQVG
jgi:SAM-dependent methyltransferase